MIDQKKVGQSTGSNSQQETVSQYSLLSLFRVSPIVGNGFVAGQLQPFATAHAISFPLARRNAGVTRSELASDRPSPLLLAVLLWDGSRIGV